MSSLQQVVCRSGGARSSSEVSKGLRQLILQLYDKHLTPHGKALNYHALKGDPDFKTFVNATAELQKVELAPLSREERMAFFINIYNAVVVHALAVFAPASNLQQRLGPPCRTFLPEACCIVLLLLHHGTQVLLRPASLHQLLNRQGVD